MKLAAVSPDSRRAGLVAVCFAASSWGTWPLIVHHGHQSGLVVGFLTMLVMAVPAIGLGRQLRTADRGAFLALAVIGVADAANVALYFSALEAGPVVVAVLTHYLAPVLVALAAPMLLGEPRSTRAVLALPAMLVGLFFVLPSTSEAGSASTAALLGGLSAIAYAALVLATRRAAQAFTRSPSPASTPCSRRRSCWVSSASARSRRASTKERSCSCSARR